jgi:hypothetical protein
MAGFSSLINRLLYSCELPPYSKTLNGASLQSISPHSPLVCCLLVCIAGYWVHFIPMQINDISQRCHLVCINVDYLDAD